MIVVVLNVTTPDGLLLGRVELMAEDLIHRRAAESIGQQVLDELPDRILDAAKENRSCPGTPPAPSP